MVANLQRRFDEYERRRREQGRTTDQDFEAIYDEFHRYMSQSPCEECKGTRLRMEARHVKRRRQVDRRDDRADHPRRVRLPEEPDAAPGADRRWPSASCARSASGCRSWSTSASTTCRSTARRPRCRAARPSASAWPPRSAAALVGVLYILDEPSASACTSATTPACLHAAAAARPRQHRAGRRARRGHHPRRRLRHRHGPQGRRRRRAHRRRGHARGHRRQHPVADRRLPVGAQDRSRCRATGARAATGASRMRGAPGPQPAQPHRALPRRACFTCVTGVSGSGKSTLVIDTLLPALKQRLHGQQDAAGEFDEASRACSTSTR